MTLSASRAGPPIVLRAPATCHPIGDKPPGATPAELELRERNHPGTMSHTIGPFARRTLNLEAILRVPVADGATGRILLLVAGESRLEQVERLVAKLHDVLSVQHPDLGPDFITRLAAVTAAVSLAPAA